jgi:hypothetical protein
MVIFLIIRKLYLTFRGEKTILYTDNDERDNQRRHPPREGPLRGEDVNNLDLAKSLYALCVRDGRDLLIDGLDIVYDVEEVPGNPDKECWFLLLDDDGIEHLVRIATPHKKLM